MRHGDTRGGGHPVVPDMHGVAGDDDGAATGGFQALDSPQQPRQWIGAARPQRVAAVGDSRVGPEYGGDMVLVFRGLCQQGQAQHELRAGQRAHPAQHPQNSVDHRDSPQEHRPGMRDRASAVNGKSRAIFPRQIPRPYSPARFPGPSPMRYQPSERLTRCDILPRHVRHPRRVMARPRAGHRKRYIVADLGTIGRGKRRSPDRRAAPDGPSRQTGSSSAAESLRTWLTAMPTRQVRKPAADGWTRSSGSPGASPSQRGQSGSSTTTGMRSCR